MKGIKGSSGYASGAVKYFTDELALRVQKGFRVRPSDDCASSNDAWEAAAVNSC